MRACGLFFVAMAVLVAAAAAQECKLSEYAPLNTVYVPDRPL